MKNKRNRAWRRNQDRRIERKAYLKFKTWSSYSYNSYEEKHERDVYQSKVLKNNMKNCSCFMCGNPRLHFKQLTIQELKALDNFKSQEF